jgi:glycosyltransferase involved in cell wall biosynthesis
VQSAHDRPRVLLAVTSGHIGGAQTYVASLVRELAGDFDLFVAANGKGFVSESAEVAGATFVDLRWMRRGISWRDPLALVELVVLMRRIRPKIVHLNSSKAGFVGRLAAKLARVPISIFTVHGWSFRPHSGGRRLAALALERLIRPLTTVMVFPAEATRSDGLAARTCAPEQSVVIPNAVPLAPTAAARSNGDVPLVVSVARLSAQKDVSTLIRALALLQPDGWRAAVIGDGNERAAIEREISARGLDSRVELLGDRDDVPEMLARADIFALSSRWEALPISILEAMAAGLPVVATEVDGVPELVVDGETGFLVPSGHPEELAAAITRLLEDEKARKAMGSAGRARVADRFAIEAFGRAHRDLYERELERVAGATAT